MSVKKRDNKHVLVHCHGKDKGKVIAAGSKEKMEAMHRAIQAKKHKKK